MSLKPTKVPLTVKEFEEERIGLCAGCGCACGYIAYIKDNKLVDLYGHPADPRGVGSLCTKGITYIQQATYNPLRLRGVFLRRGEEFVKIGHEEAIRTIGERLKKGRTAFLLGRQAGLEEYVLARDTGEVFVDTPVVDFLPSTLKPTQWKEAKFILSVDTEPVFSEVMATRWLVDAVERGAYLFCLSSRYETLCAKAKERLLLKPDLIIEFLQKLISPEKEEAKAEFVKRNLYLLKGSLVLIGTGILASPFRKALLHILSQLRKKYGVNYSLVGDVMPFKAEELDRFVERLEEFDNIVVVGNLFRYLRDEHLEALRSKLVISFQSFPNLTAHHSDLVFASTMFHERDFINYRHGFGYLAYSQKAIQPDEETYNPYEVLSHILGRTADLEGFLSELCVDAGKLREEGEQNLKLPSIEDAELTPGGFKGSELFLYVDTSLVEELGHWNPWTHEMEKEQRARINPETARRLGIKDRIKLRGVELEVQLDSNIAKGLVFVPSEYDEFQPFDPGHRVGKLLNSPSNRYEVIEW